MEKKAENDKEIEERCAYTKLLWPVRQFVSSYTYGNVNGSIFVPMYDRRRAMAIMAQTWQAV
jgi:hypothetical protein